MLLALICGITLAIVGKALLQQWLSGALIEARPARTSPARAALSPVEFPRLAPPARTRPAARPIGSMASLRRAA
ncbi:MAG: hypothetical protein AB7F65_04055 [Dehalococcoidia bacterium]